MADVIDIKQAKGKKKDETIDVYQCHCASFFWIKTSVGDVCGFCESSFSLPHEDDEEE